MTSFTHRARSLLHVWREDVDAAAATLPGVGPLFARRWRVLRVEPGGMRYCDGKGGELFIADAEPAAAARTAIEGLSRTGPLVLRFSPSRGFRRQARFPGGASGHLDEAARLALPRLSPLPVAEVAFALERDSLTETEGRIEVSLAIVRRTDLDAALARAEALGLPPTAADLEGDEPDAAPACDLRSGRRAPGAGWSAFRWGGALALLLLIAGAGFTLDARLRLAPQLAALETPAEISAALNAAIVQARAKAGAGAAVTAIADMSRRLPDGAYLTSFAYDDGAVRVTGLAWDAAATLRALDAAPEFDGAAFAGATVRDEASGRERFEMTARHRPASGRVPGGSE